MRVERGADGGGGGVDDIRRRVRYVLLKRGEILANLRRGVGRGLNHPRHPRDLLSGLRLGVLLGSLFAVHRVELLPASGGVPPRGRRRRRRPTIRRRPIRHGRSHRQRRRNPRSRHAVRRRPPRLLPVLRRAPFQRGYAHRQRRRAGGAVPGPRPNAVRVRAHLEELARQGQRRRAGALDHRAARVPQRGSAGVHGRGVG